MALPLSNTTCDIYRPTNSPPAAPDVAGVKCFLAPDFAASHLAAVQAGGTNQTAWRWTHVLLVAATVDVRDPYKGGGPGGETAGLVTDADKVFVPDKNGTPFTVIFVERLGLGTSLDAKRVYLQRQVPVWPTNNL
jgi:hypothetical protein